MDQIADMADRTLPAAEERLGLPLVEAMQTQRAVRRLLPDPVDPDIVLRCIELALKAPTGSNMQNWVFVVVTDREVKAKLGRMYRSAWGPYSRIGRRAARNDAKTRRVIDAVQWQVDNFEDLPVLVVPCLRGLWPPAVLPAPAIMQTSYYGSIYPAVQNLLLAARAVGLGAALVTLPLWNMWRARRILGLPVGVRPACVVPLGWPRGRYGPTTRRPVGDVVHLNRYGEQPWRS